MYSLVTLAPIELKHQSLLKLEKFSTKTATISIQHPSTYCDSAPKSMHPFSNHTHLWLKGPDSRVAADDGPQSTRGAGEMEGGVEEEGYGSDIVVFSEGELERGREGGREGEGKKQK